MTNTYTHITQPIYKLKKYILNTKLYVMKF